MKRLILSGKLFATWYLVSFFPCIDTAIQPILLGTNIVNVLSSIVNEHVSNIINFSHNVCFNYSRVSSEIFVITSAPFVITRPGRYMVSNDLLVGSGQTAITILSNDVLLDLGGCSIMGQDATPTTGVQVGDINLFNSVSNVKIHNGSIVNVNTGIRCSRVEYDGYISSVDLLSTFMTGIELNSSNSVAMDDLNVSGGSVGITLMNSLYTELVHLTIDGMSSVGISVDVGTRSTVIDDVVVVNNFQGIVISGDGTIIHNADILLNSANGITISESASNTIIKNNEIDNNGGIGISIRGGSAGGIIIKDSGIFNNGEDGIAVNAVAVIIGVHSIGNVGYGINISGFLAPTDLLMQDTIVCNNSGGDYNNGIVGTLTSVDAIRVTNGY